MNILFNSNEINNKVVEMAQRLNVDYSTSTKPLLIIGVLNGSYMFLSDLTKYLNIPFCEIEFVKIKSYINNVRSNNIEVVYSNLDEYNLNNYNILIVEDIIDTGCTMSYFKQYLIDTYNLNTLNTSIKVCTCLYKKFKNLTTFEPDYVVFELDKDYYVVGYGMDNCNNERNLPYIYSLN